MKNNTCSIFYSGENVDTILFKCALYWAGCGEPVWFISPTPFTTLPIGWTEPPDREILKLIYFMYMPDTKALLCKLSDIHLLPKLPKMIIIMEMDHYLVPSNNEINLTNMAFVVSSLLDATSVFSNKYSSPSFLITSVENITNQKLQTIIDLYFSFNFKVCENTYEQIEDIFKNFNLSS